MNDTNRNFNEKTGKKIMELRIQKQYTRECLAELADISPKFLYEVEMGKKGCSSYVLYRLAESLNVSVDYLVDNFVGSSKEIEELCKNFQGQQREMIGDIIRILYEIVHAM